MQGTDVGCLIQKIRSKLTSIILRENWMIGVIDQPISQSLRWTECPPVKWLTLRSRMGYFADPFPWPDRPNIILCEYYSFASRQGTLARLELKDGRVFSEAAENFPVSGHLSFPFLFKHEGEVYSIPESCEAREASIYRWQEESCTWIKYVTPIEGIAAADSVLFEQGGYFWIAYTDVDKGAWNNLNLCYALNIEGPWIQHKANPVSEGLKHSRCGGAPFYADGQLYRPAQDCSKAYGGAIRIMHIKECSPELFQEEEVTTIAPERGRNPHGFHHISAWGNQCLVDGKRMMISPGQVVSTIIRRLFRSS